MLAFSKFKNQEVDWYVILDITQQFMEEITANSDGKPIQKKSVSIRFLFCFDICYMKSSLGTDSKSFGKENILTFKIS
jgi:hypothetical protein